MLSEAYISILYKMIKLFKQSENRSEFLGREIILAETKRGIGLRDYQQINYMAGYELKANPHNKVKIEYEDGIIRKARDDD